MTYLFCCRNTHKNLITPFKLKTTHTHTTITDIVVTPRTVIIISQIIAIGKDHKTLYIVHTTDHNIVLTIDHTIIHKTDHTIDNNTNTALKLMR